MTYFPLFWLCSVIFHILFFIKLKSNEANYGIIVDKYIGLKFPEIKKVKSIIRNTNDIRKKRDYRLLLIYLYLGYGFFFIPFIVYFVTGIWFRG